MGGIKYYQLAKGEEMPDEFCVVRDVNGEPSEYMFYVPEAENAKLREELESVGTAAYLYGRSDLKAENAKLRELADYMTPIAWYAASEQERDRMRELGVEVDA